MHRVAIFCVLLLSTPCFSLTIEDLEFEAGPDALNYSVLGKPNNVRNIAPLLPSDTLQNVYAMLPEGVAINTDFISDLKSTSIAIDDELGENTVATVSVTFLNEGAGYRNSLGYFVFDTLNPPQSIDAVNTHTIIFPNSSKSPDGELVEGDTVDLNVELTPGQSIGFFVLSNGWGWSGSYNNIISLGNSGSPFYSLTHLNPEATSLHRKHNVAFLDIENDFIVIGFEDLYRPDGDNDFNDLLFTVHVTPFTAIDGVNSDGTTNANFDVLTQKNAQETTVTNIYPAANSWATLAFEDQWPALGDYDFNDVVFHYRLTEVMDGQRNVQSISGIFDLQGMGGDYHSGFAIRFPNVNPDNVAQISLVKDGNETLPLPNIGESDLILTLTEDLRNDLVELGLVDQNCRFFRTLSTCLQTQNTIPRYEFSIQFIDPVAKTTLGSQPYDPFIFATPGYYHGDGIGFQPGATWETHLKQFSGTGRMDSILFNLLDDASNSTNFFITQNNFPWVINLSYPWQHPLEAVDISHAYLQFPGWVNSSGETNGNWYLNENAVQSRTIGE